MNYDPLRQPAPIVLAIGAVIGLVIGLLIGWVFWPVEWTGATLRDLYPEAKAEYIAAVADAYAIYDNQEARAIAQRRLAQLGDDNLQQSVEEALRYFQESQISDRAIRDSNIRRLAVALNMSQPNTAAAAQGLPTVSAQATTPPAQSEATGELGWMGWLLWLLTALLLLAGGIYILSKAGLPDFRSLLKPRQKLADEIDEFDDPPARQRRHQQNTTAFIPGEVGAFDQEDDDWPPAAHPVAGSSRRVPSQSPVDDERVHRSTTHVYAASDELTDEHDDESYDDDSFDNDSFDDEGFDDEGGDGTGYHAPSLTQEAFDDDADQWRPKRQPYTIDVAQDVDTAVGANPARDTAPASPTAPMMKPDVTEDPDQSLQSHEPPKAALFDGTVIGRPQQTTRSTAAPSSRRPVVPTRMRNPVIDQHIFHYRIGMAEYDESRPIVDPQSGKYIGEFGLGASHKNGVAQMGPDQLVALEVWLFDKSDERNLGNQTRILLSEYAIDHNLEQMFLKERQDNPRPFTAQPGVHFQLESQNLLLDCTIKDVEYSANNTTKGIFQEITVDMTVQQKK